jgi:putative photosynthetic complex assembly protein
MSSALHHHHGDAPFPRGALWFVAGAIGFTLVAATAVRLGFAPIAASPVAVRSAAHLVPTSSRTLSFADAAGGGLVITDVATGTVAKDIKPGEPSGFIRGLLRGLSRERRMKGVGKEVPYRLESWPNGQLSLTDTGTGRSIELSAFGPDNRAFMVGLLK